jgi:hypothetical protein
MHKRGRSLDGGDTGDLNSGAGRHCEGEKEGCTGLEGTVPSCCKQQRGHALGQAAHSGTAQQEAG